MVALAFGAVFVVELPDKTFIATLVLSTRYRPLAVWIGVGLAFLVQTVVAISVGTVVTLLPEDLVHAVAALIFALGGVLLLRTARGAEAAADDEERELAGEAGDTRTGLRAAGASFLVLFAAEWGDLSQLLTISLVARYRDPLSVFVGAFGALLAVSGLAVLLGRVLRHRMPLSLLHYVGGALCLALGVLSASSIVA